MTLYDLFLGVLFWSAVLVGVVVAAGVSFGVPIALILFAVRNFKEGRRGRAILLLLAAAACLSIVALYFLLPELVGER